MRDYITAMGLPSIDDDFTAFDEALARWVRAEEELAQLHNDFARDIGELLAPLLNIGRGQ